MGQGMGQRMTQGMIASASMQLAMRALQATTTELEALVSEALASNPVLEEKSPNTSPRQDAAISHASFASDAHERFLASLSSETSLCDELSEQIRQSALSPKREAAALYLIENLDHRGYFSEDAMHLAQAAGFSERDSRAALEIVRELEPAGVGAHGLRESLLLQLRRLGEEAGLPARIIQENWEDLVAHRYSNIAKKLGVPEEEVREAAQRIAHLNPDPGSAFSRTATQISSPDLIIEEECDDEGEIQFSVRLAQEKIPQLALSADYRSMMAERADNEELRRYLSRCFRAGRELIHALELRQQSMLQMARALVIRQREFFLHGPKALAPLKMEQLAEDTGMHLSTISRAARGKYLQCRFGIFELRHFFSTALSKSDAQGLMEESVSAKAVQHRIREIIHAEDPAKPLSDAKIEAQLGKEGIHIARRTIAKYREAMKILPASLRKQR